jgi:hypothetical protein
MAYMKVPIATHRFSSVYRPYLPAASRQVSQLCIGLPIGSIGYFWVSRETRKLRRTAQIFMSEANLTVNETYRGAMRL